MRAFLLLTAVVLACIGIGIGAESAAGPAVYGPVGAQFTATFPGPVSTETVTPVGHPPGGPTATYSFTGTRGHEQLRVQAGIFPLSTPLRISVGHPVAYGSRASILFASKPGQGPERRLTFRRVTVAGRSELLGVACVGAARLARFARGARPARFALCGGVMAGLLTATNRGVVQWSATAWGKSAPQVRALLTSVAPTGS